MSNDFTGLMKSLNLDESQFKPYSTDFEESTFKEISSTKTEIEAQLTILFDLLHTQYHADMDTPLVKDGFPRADIDVLSIRLIRVKIIRLRNDHKQVLKTLESKMIEEFATRQNNPDEPAAEIKEPVRAKVNSHTIPFAQVGQVAVNGPADKSGLKEGDNIIVFDKDIHVTNHQNLSSLATRVGRRVDQPIEVEILRDGSRITLTLVPTNDWDGQGLLGCRVIPL